MPLVFLQAADECNTLQANSARLRMLEVVNAHNAGHAHGVLLPHEGMRVRFTQEIDATAGLVQAQNGSIVEFMFQRHGAERYV